MDRYDEVRTIFDLVQKKTGAGAMLAMKDGASIEAVVIGRLGLTAHIAVDRGIKLSDVADALDIPTHLAEIAIQGSREIVAADGEMAEWFKVLSAEVEKAERGKVLQ